MTRANRRPLRRRLDLLIGLTSCVLGACASGDTIEFETEEVFLPDFRYDTGFVPSGEPVQFRVVATATGTMNARALGIVDGDQLEPVRGSGELTLDGGLDLEFFANLNLAGLSFNERVHAIEVPLPRSMTQFDPFLDENEALIEVDVAPVQFASIPIDAFPSGAITLSVEGGVASLALRDGCAEVADGLAQFAGTLAISGHVVLGATFEIELPVLGVQSFGPLAVRVDLPALAIDLDLGTFTTDGTRTQELGPCSVADGDGGDGDGDGDGEDANCGLPTELSFDQPSALSAFVTLTPTGELSAIETAAGFFTGDAVSDLLFVTLEAGGVLGAAIEPGVYEWSSSDGSLESCSLCAEIRTNIGTVVDGRPDALLVPTQGTISIAEIGSTVDSTISMELANLKFREVDIADGSTPIASGCETTLTSMAINATVREIQ